MNHIEVNTAQSKTWNGLPVALWRLIGIQAMMNASHFMAMPLLAVYCSTSLKLSVVESGFVLSVYFVAARVTPVVVAPLADRFGLWAAVILGLTLRGVGFIGIYFADGGLSTIVMAGILGLGTSVYEAGAYGVIGAQPQIQRERLIIYNAQGLNIGCVLGPLLGAALAYMDIGLPLLASGGLFLALALAAVFEGSDIVAHHKPQFLKDSFRFIFADKYFLVLCIALMPWWALFAQLFAAFPIEAVNRGGEVSWAGSVLVINGAIGFLVLFAMPTFIRLFGILGLLFVSILIGGGAVAAVAFLPGLPLLLMLVALFTCAEVAILTAAEILVGRHAAGRSVATFYALFNMSWGIGGAMGGAIGPWIASSASDGVGWPLLGAIALPSVAVLFFYRRMTKCSATPSLTGNDT